MIEEDKVVALVGERQRNKYYTAPLVRYGVAQIGTVSTNPLT